MAPKFFTYSWITPSIACPRVVKTTPRSKSDAFIQYMVTQFKYICAVMMNEATMKHIKILGLLLLLIVFCVIVISCEEGESTHDEPTTSFAGLGKSKERPQGPTFSLPAGIKLITPITGYRYKDATTDDCAPEHALKLKPEVV